MPPARLEVTSAIPLDACRCEGMRYANAPICNRREGLSLPSAHHVPMYMFKD